MEVSYILVAEEAKKKKAFLPCPFGSLFPHRPQSRFFNFGCAGHLIEGGFSSRCLDSTVGGLQLWDVGSLAPRHVQSSQTRDGTCVPCMAGGFLTARPPGESFFLVFKTLSLNLTSGIASSVFFVYFCLVVFSFFIEWI